MNCKSLLYYFLHHSEICCNSVNVALRGEPYKSCVLLWLDVYLSSAFLLSRVSRVLGNKTYFLTKSCVTFAWPCTSKNETNHRIETSRDIGMSECATIFNQDCSCNFTFVLNPKFYLITIRSIWLPSCYCCSVFSIRILQREFFFYFPISNYMLYIRVKYDLVFADSACHTPCRIEKPLLLPQLTNMPTNLKQETWTCSFLQATIKFSLT